MTRFKLLYVIAAAYDGLLGLAFLVAGPRLYAYFHIVPPNHWGYVKFAAGVLVIFGWMFLEIARKPRVSRNLIAYGILLKLCYIGTVGWYWARDGLPLLWTSFALADAVFVLLFLWSYQAYSQPERS